VHLAATFRFQNIHRLTAHRIEQRKLSYEIGVVAYGGEKALVEVHNIAFCVGFEMPGMDLSWRHIVHLVRFYRVRLEIDGMLSPTLREQNDLVKGMPMRKDQIGVTFHEIADAHDKKFSHALVGAEQVANAVCWDLLRHGLK
jgi:hypothetical protein